MLKKADVLQLMFFLAFLESLFTVFYETRNDGFDLMKYIVLFIVYFIFTVMLNLVFVIITVFVFRNKANDYTKWKDRVKHIVNFKLKYVNIFAAAILILVVSVAIFTLSIIVAEENPMMYLLQNLFFITFIAYVTIANNTKVVE